MDASAGARKRSWWRRRPDGAPRQAALEVLLGPERYASVVLPSLWSWFAPTVAGVLVTAVLVSGTIPRGRLAVAVGLALLGAPAIALARMQRWRSAAAMYGAMGVFFCVLALLCIWLVSPRYEVAAVAIPALITVALVFLRPPHALLVGVVGILGFAAIVLLGDGFVRPAAHISLVLTFSLSAGGFLAWVMDLVHQLAEEERRTSTENQRLATELAAANVRLQRYLAPHVATAVAAGADSLAPHRARIAVAFVDLRGFTRFTGDAEPEDVVELLGEYYAAVGEAATTHGATVGSFAGDGVILWFGDPEPVDDPADRALRLAVALAGPVDELSQRWSRRGYRLGCGVGIALGYATLGTVGFEGRSDYTALGSVVNLASRLCGEAGHGEVLLDARAFEALADPPSNRREELRLKGFGEPVVTHRVATA